MKPFLYLIMFLACLDGNAQYLPPQLKVPFLESAPVVDGILDTPLKSLAPYHLSSEDTSVQASQRETMRIAYGTGFLYLYTEIPGDSLIFRDRGYQNGDGMIVVLGKPGAGDQPTREFYVLGFTAQPAGKTDWQTKFIWYRNVGLQMSRLYDAQFKATQHTGMITMECLVPWSEVYPYHPWLSEGIGLNIAVVNAVGSNGKDFWYLRKDEQIGSEQSPRQVVKLTFDPPRLSYGSQGYATLSANHFREGEKISLRLATCFSKGDKETIRISFYSGEHTRISSLTSGQEMRSALTVSEIELPVTGLPSGGYQLDWSNVSGKSKGTLWFTVLPGGTIDELTAALDKKRSDLSQGSYSTIRFMLDDLRSGLDSLKPYETAFTQRSQINEILALVNSNRDLLSARSGIFRRGFLSEVDSSYRPYSINVPAELEAGKRYPLMVFLHGSGQDDRNILEQLPDYGNEMIIVAPNGRGTSNCYSADHAQEDIEEAVEDVIRNYPVDTTRIVLSGFSMGGYGVYRTFYENPSRYRCLAIFSGGPDLATRWIGPEEPDFLEERYLVPFKGERIFIFHGTEDLNVPIETTKKLVEKLKKEGADVTFVTEKKGHESPGQETINQFREWLRVSLER